MRILRRACVAALVLLPLFAAASFVAVRRPQPPRTGTHRLAGLTAAVEIVYDARAIPHLRARTTEDAFRALGWLHAGDRFFQMELRRRFATGRLSEVVGPAGFGEDVDARREGHGRLAARDERSLTEEDRRVAQAYAAGVNAYLVAHPRSLELVALGIEPEPWTVQDSLAFGRGMNAFLSDSGDREAAVLRAVGAHGLDAVVQALEVEDGKLPHRPPLDGFDLGPFDEDPSEPPGGGASNAFALAGSRTKSGKPILASDPHLPLEPIPVWYAAHLTSDDGLDVAGFTLAGLPFVAIGHNGRVAWGITMQQADDTDLFLESGPGTSFVETIAIRGERARPVVVSETSRGPVIGRAGNFAVVRARACRQTATRLEPFLGAARARNGDDLAAAFRRYDGPPINVVWADASGRIGLRTAGAIPVRSAGDGRIPVPILAGSYGWTGFVPVEELPATGDPAEGFAASGNDDGTLAGHPLPYPGHYLGKDRIGRLREVLAATTEGTVAGARALQNDLVSLYARRIVGTLAAMRFDDPRAERARELLARWDGRADLRGTSLLFFATMTELRRTALGARERPERGTLPIGWEGLAAMIGEERWAGFWDDPLSPGRETREAVLSAALAAALERIEREDGPEPADWSFGRRHTVTFEHPFSPVLPWLRGWLDIGPVELPGDWFTPRVAGFPLRRGSFRVVHIQSMRMIVDLADPDASRWVLPPGQSAHLGDPHRDDQLATWAAGADFAWPFTRDAVDAAAVSRVALVP